ERNDVRAVAMNDRLHVGTGSIDFAVNEPLDVAGGRAFLHRHAVEVVLEDVGRRDQRGRPGARKKIMIRVARIPQADVPVSVENRFVREDSVRVDLGYQYNTRPRGAIARACITRMLAIALRAIVLAE